MVINAPLTKNQFIRKHLFVLRYFFEKDSKKVKTMSALNDYIETEYRVYLEKDLERKLLTLI